MAVYNQCEEAARRRRHEARVCGLCGGKDEPDRGRALVLWPGLGREPRFQPEESDGDTWTHRSCWALASGTLTVEERLLALEFAHAKSNHHHSGPIYIGPIGGA